MYKKIEIFTLIIIAIFILIIAFIVKFTKKSYFEEEVEEKGKKIQYLEEIIPKKKRKIIYINRFWRL